MEVTIDDQNENARIASVLRVPAMRPVSREHWLAAAVIGGLRMAANKKRSSERNRGDQKNMLNDLQGAIGEIIGLAYLTDQFPDASVQAKLLVWGDGSSPALTFDPDLVLREGSTELRLEAKATFPDVRKHRLLINDRAYKRSCARGAEGFLPIVTAPGADLACVGRLVETSEVESWRIEDLGYGDSSRGVLLNVASKDIWGAPWQRLASISPSTVAQTDWLWRIMVGAQVTFDAIRSQGFTFEGPIQNALEGTTALARDCYRAGLSDHG